MLGLLNGLQAASGLMGMLRRNRDPYARQKQQYLDQYNNRQNLLWSRAMNYNPAMQDRSAVNYATGQAGHALQNAMMGLNQRFKTDGGSPTGDTNFSVMAQRAVDDSLNPLGGWLADRASSQFDRKQSALNSALGAAPGQVMNAYDAMRSSPTNFQPSQEMFGNALTSIFQPSAPKTLVPRASKKKK